MLGALLMSLADHASRPARYLLAQRKARRQQHLAVVRHLASRHFFTLDLRSASKRERAGVARGRTRSVPENVATTRLGLPLGAICPSLLFRDVPRAHRCRAKPVARDVGRRSDDDQSARRIAARTPTAELRVRGAARRPSRLFAGGRQSECHHEYGVGSRRSLAGGDRATARLDGHGGPETPGRFTQEPRAQPPR